MALVLPHPVETRHAPNLFDFCAYATAENPAACSWCVAMLLIFLCFATASVRNNIPRPETENKVSVPKA